MQQMVSERDTTIDRLKQELQKLTQAQQQTNSNSSESISKLDQELQKSTRLQKDLQKENNDLQAGMQDLQREKKKLQQSLQELEETVASLRHESGVFKQEKMSIVSVTYCSHQRYSCLHVYGSVLKIPWIHSFVALLVIMLKCSGSILNFLLAELRM